MNPKSNLLSQTAPNRTASGGAKIPAVGETFAANIPSQPAIELEDVT